jgi:hypothetical protein
MTLEHFNVCRMLLNCLIFFKYSAIVLSWPSDTCDTPSSPLNTWRQSEITVRSVNCIDKVRTEDPNPFADMVSLKNKLAAFINFASFFCFSFTVVQSFFSDYGRIWNRKQRSGKPVLPYLFVQRANVVSSRVLDFVLLSHLPMTIGSLPVILPIIIELALNILHVLLSLRFTNLRRV